MTRVQLFKHDEKAMELPINIVVIVKKFNENCSLESSSFEKIFSSEFIRHIV